MKEKIQAKILLVDDEEDFITSLASRLEIRGLHVTTATRGAAAIEFVHNKIFDVVVLDLNMPGMDGLETLAKIKGDSPETEVIMLSGKGSIKTSTEAIKLGAQDFYEKPLEISKLLQVIIEAKDRRILAMELKAEKDVKSIVKNMSW